MRTCPVRESLVHGPAVVAAALGLAIASGAAARPGQPTSIFDSLDRFAPGEPLPANQPALFPGCPSWSGTGLSVVGSVGGTSVAEIELSGLSGSSLRADAVAGRAPGNLRVRFSALPSAPARVSFDAVQSGTLQSTTFEVADVSTGFIIGRLLLGADSPIATGCNGTTSGASPNIFILRPCPSTPEGAFVDTGVAVPLNARYRIEAAIAENGGVAYTIDRNDGQGPRPLGSSTSLSGTTAFDRVAFARVGGAGGTEAVRIDNLRISGGTVTPLCPGDATRDARTDFADLNAVLGQFAQVGAPGSLAGDVNGDGIVNFSDLNLVLGNFGVVCVCGPG